MASNFVLAHSNESSASHAQKKKFQDEEVPSGSRCAVFLLSVVVVQGIQDTTWGKVKKELANEKPAAKRGGIPAKADKVDICHFDEDTGTFSVINISGNAVDKHIANHGDKIPGGGELDENCEPVDEPVEECPCWTADRINSVAWVTRSDDGSGDGSFVVLETSGELDVALAGLIFGTTLVCNSSGPAIGPEAMAEITQAEANACVDLLRSAAIAD